MGGNSTKATSGINGALTRTQVDTEIKDSVKQFYEDTLKSARDKARPDLIKVLTYKSASAVEWLQDVFNLDLTLVSRLGGHSFPRTHRGHDAKFPGMAITYALMQRFEELAEKEPERMQLIKKAKVNKIINEGNSITGVEYEFGGETCRVDGPVILATGGYAADFGETSLLKKWRPDTFDLASTNGQHATGDGHKMLMSIGANGIDMDKVQVHPTGLIDPKDPGSKWKFLAAEGRFDSRVQIWIDSDIFQLSVVKVVSCSTARVIVSLTSSVTETTYPARCSTRRKKADGQSALSSTPSLPTSSISTLVTTRDVA